MRLRNFYADLTLSKASKVSKAQFTWVTARARPVHVRPRCPKPEAPRQRQNRPSKPSAGCLSRFFARADWTPGTTNWMLQETKNPSKINTRTVWTLRTLLSSPKIFPTRGNESSQDRIGSPWPGGAHRDFSKLDPARFAAPVNDAQITHDKNVDIGRNA